MENCGQTELVDLALDCIDKFNQTGYQSLYVKFSSIILRTDGRGIYATCNDNEKAEYMETLRLENVDVVRWNCNMLMLAIMGYAALHLDASKGGEVKPRFLDPQYIHDKAKDFRIGSYNQMRDIIANAPIEGLEDGNWKKDRSMETWLRCRKRHQIADLLDIFPEKEIVDRTLQLPRDI
ncbi:hypothetical protein ColLi_13917 [Colletotrichum liriopes]|uniref:Uncharacterized protein n=1 Tax=Colletotrichum liriopes TaxID=708192 RepID=A0AA37GZ67_9PEZI|nr:hypothetical protein ColLi_12873 [Colletotrichum liriopes]GJC91079.1 hypothetical protein ColLi_13917 [Colletotrichum liriopes]